MCFKTKRFKICGTITTDMFERPVYAIQNDGGAARMGQEPLCVLKFCRSECRTQKPGTKLKRSHISGYTN